MKYSALRVLLTETFESATNACLDIIAEEIGIKPPLPAWAEPDADALDEGINVPELLAQLVRRLAAGERGNRLIDALATAIARSDDALCILDESMYAHVRYFGCLKSVPNSIK